MKRKQTNWSKKWVYLIAAGFISDMSAVALGNLASHFSDSTCLAPSLSAYLIAGAACTLAVIPLLIAAYGLINALKLKSQKLIVMAIMLGLVYGVLSLVTGLMVAFACWLA